MILINLLPHREAARKRRKEAFQITMFMSVIAGLLVVGLIIGGSRSAFKSSKTEMHFYSQKLQSSISRSKKLKVLKGKSLP